MGGVNFFLSKIVFGECYNRWCFLVFYTVSLCFTLLTCVLHLLVTLLNCEYRNCEYCFCDLTFANVAIMKYIPLKIANLAIVKYISINIANFLILYNLQLITQQMSSCVYCVIYFAVYLWYLEHFVFIHCSDVRWTINEELVNNTIPNTIFFMPK